MAYSRPPPKFPGQFKSSMFESPTTRGAGGLDFSAIGGKKQRHGSALIGAGLKKTNKRLTPMMVFVRCACKTCNAMWGCSSVGRAHDWQS